MLNKLLFSHSSELYNLDFIQDKASSRQVLFIAPSPSIADMVRTKLNNQHPEQNIEVVTISKFVSDCYEQFEHEIEFEKLNKANLMMYLGVGWKKFFPDESYEKFLRAYNLLTDIRSFTLDSGIIEEVLEEYDETLKNAVKVFYALMESQNFFDEHKNYFYLSEKFRETLDYPHENREIVFFGFNFFSGAQIDFIKSLAIRDNIYIPINLKVYEESIQSDWTKWLEGNEIKLASQQVQSTKIKTIYFPKNNLAYSLRNNLKDIRMANIYLGTRNAKSSEYLEVPLNAAQFKVSIDLLAEDINNFRMFVDKKLFLANQGTVSYQDLFKAFEDFQKKQFEDNQKSVEQNIKIYKLKSLILNFLNKWKDLSEVNNSLSKFDFDLLLDVISLNSPRNSFVTFSENVKYKIFDLSGIDQFDPNGINILTAKSDYDSLKSSRPRNSLEVEKLLSSIGPVRRSELEFNILKQKIKELLYCEDTVLVIEEGLREHDLSWNNLLEEFELVDITATVVNKVKKNEYDFLKSKKLYHHTSLSPTRLQSYLDCQKQFYFKYVDPIMPNIKLDEVLQLNDLGTLEHLVVEKYFHEQKQYSYQLVAYTAKKYFDQFIATQGKVVSITDYNVYLSEITNYSNNGIKTLFAIKEKLPNLNFEFEIELAESVSNKNRQGRVDFFADSETNCLLIDFKRSSGSIPDRAKLLRIEKVQVWFYLRLLQDIGKWSENKSFMIGYLNLSKSDGSLFISNDDHMIDQLKGIDGLKGSKFYLFDDKWSEAYHQYRDLEDSTIEEMINNNEFYINPKNENVCNFCGVKNICPKAEVLTEAKL